MKRFQNVPGVGQVQVSGGVARQVLVNLRPAQMQSQGVGVDEIIAAIRAANMDVPAGKISHGPTEQLVRIEGRIKEPAGFGRIIVARRANGPVYLDQVADVVDGEQRGRLALAHQRPARPHHPGPEGAGRQHRRGGQRREGRREGAREGRCRPTWS